MSTGRVVVVGASLAGATTAVRLRELGFDGDLALVGDEAHLPYERPPLTKGFLTGKVEPDALLVHPAARYDELGVALRLGVPAAGLDLDGRVVRLADGSDVPYDRLVIATGSVNVRPSLPGMDLAGVHQLRRLDEAERLASDATTARRAVVIGMGFIGCEVAATLRGLGLDVTMVDRLAGPLLAQAGPELSGVVCGWHEEHGVRLVPDAAVEELVGDGGRVVGVRLPGDVLPADVVVVGVGVRPATAWLREASLHLVGGAVGVDAEGRSSHPCVFAAGDVAAVWNGSSHVRTEHYRSALDSADRVAHAVLGLPVPPVAPSWFWSDQYDHVLHLAGSRDDTEVHLRPDPYAAFYLRGTVLRAVATVDSGRDFRRALKLLGRDVQTDVLVDPAADLRTAGA